MYPSILPYIKSTHHGFDVKVSGTFNSLPTILALMLEISTSLEQAESKLTNLVRYSSSGTNPKPYGVNFRYDISNSFSLLTHSLLTLTTAA